MTETITVTEDDSEIIYNITIEAISEEYAGFGQARGKIIDAGTGRGVSGLTLYIRRVSGIQQEKLQRRST